MLGGDVVQEENSWRDTGTVLIHWVCVYGYLHGQSVSGKASDLWEGISGLAVLAHPETRLGPVFHTVTHRGTHVPLSKILWSTLPNHFRVLQQSVFLSLIQLFFLRCFSDGWNPLH